MKADKSEQEAKFKQAQDDMRALSQKVPSSWARWDYAKTVHYKKILKECDKFPKLKVTDCSKSFIRIDNQLSKLKQYY
jgi:hypothetical protein